MKPSKHKLVRKLFALSVLAFVASGWLGPMLFDSHGAQPVGAAQASNQHIVHIDAPSMLFDRPLLVLERATVSMAPPANGRALSDAEVAAKLHDGSANLVLSDAKFVLDASGLHAARTAAVSEAVAGILRPITDMSFATLSVADAKIMYRPGGALEDSLLGHVTCEITKSGATELQAKGTLKRDGVTLPFDISINTKNAKSASARLPVSVKIASDLVTASFSGEYVRGEAFKLTSSNASIATPQAKRLIGWLSGDTITGNGLDEFSAKGPLDWSGQTITFEEAKFTVDGNEANGTLSLNLGGTRPSLDGTLAFANLELAPYVRPAPTTLATLTQSAIDWSRWLIGSPSSGSLIRALDADLRISATTVTSNGAALGGGAASLTMKDSKLLADIAEIEIDAETQGNARVTVDLSGAVPRYDLRGSISAPDLANAMHVLSDRQLISGAGRADIDITTSGTTDAELRQTLTGSATLSLPEGGSIAFNLASLIATAKEGGKEGTMGWGKLAGGTTTLNQLNATFEAANGVLTAKSVEAVTETRKVAVDGTIDLSQQVLDLSIAAQSKDPGNASLNERVRIRGPILAPTLASDHPSKAALKLPLE
jgi:AsmA protein